MEEGHRLLKPGKPTYEDAFIAALMGWGFLFCLVFVFGSIGQLRDHAFTWPIGVRIACGCGIYICWMMCLRIPQVGDPLAKTVYWLSRDPEGKKVFIIWAIPVFIFLVLPALFLVTLLAGL